MEKPGQRVSYPRIIEEHGLRPPVRNIIEIALTLSMWTAFILWMLPVVLLSFNKLLFPALIDIRLYETFYSQLSAVLKAGGIIAVVVLAGILCWIGYNYTLAFIRKDERRKSGRSYNTGQLAEFFDVDIESVEKFGRNNCVQVILQDARLIFRDG